MKLKKMLADWLQNGFNGVYFHECRLEPTLLQDWLDDGLTEAEHEKFIQDYAIFVVSPDFDDCFCDTAGPYVETILDTEQFYSDLKAEMLKRLGEDIKIIHYPSCEEFEIQRIEVQS